MPIMPWARAFGKRAVATALLLAILLAGACGPRKTHNLFIILADRTASTVGHEALERTHFASAVLPTAAKAHARVLLAEGGAAGLTEPKLVADETFKPTSDNPLVAAKAQKATTERLIAKLE